MADFSRKSICSTYRTLCRRSHDTDSRQPPLLGRSDETQGWQLQALYGHIYRDGGATRL